MYTLSQLEAIRDPTLPVPLFPRDPVRVRRQDGSDWTIGGNERIQVCADCIDRTVKELIPQFADALMRRHGTLERAAVGFIETGLDWTSLNHAYMAEYRSQHFGDLVIEAAPV